MTKLDEALPVPTVRLSLLRRKEVRAWDQGIWSRSLAGMSIAGRGISRPLPGRSHAWARCYRSLLSVKGKQNLVAPLS
jgi:hypothetical protein